MTERGDVLAEAKALIEGERNNHYGPPSQDFARTAALWTVVFKRPFTAHEVAMAMMLLKISRLTWQPEKRDSWVDVAGYAGCGWETVAADEPDDDLPDSWLDWYNYYRSRGHNDEQATDLAWARNAACER